MYTTLAVITRILSNSLANLYQKKASENNSPIIINLYAYFFMSALCIMPALFVNWTIFGFEFWSNVILSGILCTIGTISLIEALKIGDLSVLAPINSYKSIIGLFGAFFILKEIPTLKEFTCVLLIVFGSYFVLNTKDEPFSIKTFFRRDIRLRIFALLCSGIEASILKKIILMSSYQISLILWCFSGFICSMIIYFLYRLKTKTKLYTDKKLLNNCFTICVTLLLMQLTTNYVFSKIAVGPALALFQLSSLVSVFFGYKIYQEKNIIKKILGTIIMIISSVLLLI